MNNSLATLVGDWVKPSKPEQLDPIGHWRRGLLWLQWCCGLLWLSGADCRGLLWLHWCRGLPWLHWCGGFLRCQELERRRRDKNADTF